MQIASLTRPVLFALTAAVLIAPQAMAQATPIANGNIVNHSPEGPRTLTFSVVELPDGSIVGSGGVNNRLGGGSVVLFEINSKFVDPQGNLWLAGPITQSIGGPPVGLTAFFLISQDASQVVGLFVVPPTFPTTAAGIYSLVGSPPPQFFRTPDAGYINRNV